MMTVEQCLRAAFAALVKGDTAERDRYCRLAENLIKAGDRVKKHGPRSIVQGDLIRLPDGSLELKIRPQP